MLPLLKSGSRVATRRRSRRCVDVRGIRTRLDASCGLCDRASWSCVGARCLQHVAATGSGCGMCAAHCTPKTDPRHHTLHSPDARRDTAVFPSRPASFAEWLGDSCVARVGCIGNLEVCLDVYPCEFSGSFDISAKRLPCGARALPMRHATLRK